MDSLTRTTGCAAQHAWVQRHRHTRIATQIVVGVSSRRRKQSRPDNCRKNFVATGGEGRSSRAAISRSAAMWASRRMVARVLTMGREALGPVVTDPFVAVEQGMMTRQAGWSKGDTVLEVGGSDREVVAKSATRLHVATF